MKRFFQILCIIILPVLACIKDPTAISPEHIPLAFSTPEEQNINQQMLNNAFVQVRSLPFVDGLLIVRNGYIVAEEYYNGYSAGKPHNIKSVSKSFLSVITGIALQQGYIDSLGEKVLDYFPEYIYPGMDPRKYDITIRHLLSMQMGIESESANNYELYQQIYSSANWIKSTIELPLLSNPGDRMRYNTFQTHLLSAIITKATGQSTREYAVENLFTFMGIDIDDWEQDPQGYYFGGNSMYFTMREMAMLGMLYLNSGKINGVQIVPQSWIELSVTKTRPVDQPEWGALKEYNYGYLWWLGKINGYKLYMALGYGGQFVLVFSDFNLVVVATAFEEGPASDDQELPILQIVSDYILPAVVN